MAAANDSAGLTAIIGAGRMGLGIAESFVIAGLEVGLPTSRPNSHARAGALVERTRGHVEAGLLDDVRADRAPSAPPPIPRPSRRRPRDRGRARGPRRQGGVLRAASAAAPGAIIATNTSSLPIAGLAESGTPSASSACTGSTRRSGRRASR